MDRIKNAFRSGLDGVGNLSRGARSSERPSLLDRSKPFFTGVNRFGVAKWSMYLQDPFHTMLNLPWWKFILVFFTVYLFQFCSFALLYLAVSNIRVPDGICIHGVDNTFAHALWLSSRTASTIGFNQIEPDPECVAANLIVMIQVSSSAERSQHAAAMAC
jgi:hypothetical protein